MLSRIGAALLVVARVLWPFAVQGKAEKAGTIIAVVAALAFAVGSALPVLLGDGAPDPVPVEMVEPSDVLPGLDIVEPEDLGPFAQVVVGILGFGYGCSGAQQRAWKDSAAQFWKCITMAGVPHAGEFADALFGDAIALDLKTIGQDLWPQVINCGFAAGLALLFPGNGPPTGDSVGAMMARKSDRIAAALSGVDPLDVACGNADECWLVIVPRN